MSLFASVWSDDPLIASGISRRFQIEIVHSFEQFDSGAAILCPAEFPPSLWPGWDLLGSRKSGGLSSAVICSNLALWPIEQQTRLLLAGANRVLHASAPSFESALLGLISRNDHELDRLSRVRSEMAAAGIVGDCPAIQACFRAAARAAALSTAPVLISGETGTGKELIARTIHSLDPVRARKPFHAVNCAALVPSLLESELFGYRRGAFTGADRDRQGWLRAASGGVLFLDEIGELEPALQAKLLRVLQNNTVQPLGSDEEIPIDVRILSATNKNLEELVDRGQFREDLFHRLNVLRLRVPPLRERSADIPALARHFCALHAPSQVPAALTPTFLAALAAARWPGNVRQLENTLRAALLERDGDEPLDLSHAPAELWLAIATPPPRRPAQSENQPTELLRLLEAANWNLTGALESCERLMLESALARVAGNQSKAARLLGLTPRSVYNKLRKFRLGA